MFAVDTSVHVCMCTCVNLYLTGSFPCEKILCENIVFMIQSRQGGNIMACVVFILFMTFLLYGFVHIAVLLLGVCFVVLAVQET